MSSLASDPLRLSSPADTPVGPSATSPLCLQPKSRAEPRSVVQPRRDVVDASVEADCESWKSSLATEREIVRDVRDLIGRHRSRESRAAPRNPDRS